MDIYILNINEEINFIRLYNKCEYEICCFVARLDRLSNNLVYMFNECKM